MINGTAVNDTTSNNGEWINTTPLFRKQRKYLILPSQLIGMTSHLDVDEVNIDYVKSTFR